MHYQYSFVNADNVGINKYTDKYYVKILSGVISILIQGISVF